MTIPKRYACGWLVVSTLLGGCLPVQLEKYRKGGRVSRPADPVFDQASEPVVPAPTDAAKTHALSAAPPESPRATIYAVDRQTFHFALRDGDVWNSALNVLMRNYNLTIVDRQSGVVTTEWDSYFLNGGVFRNRVSLRITRGPSGGTDVMVHNNVEKLRDASAAASTVGAVWLPSPDPANEVARIVQNMALVLNQPPPVLPPQSAVASGDRSDLLTR